MEEITTGKDEEVRRKLPIGIVLGQQFRNIASFETAEA